MSPDTDSARQISPTTLTSPLGLRSVIATPILPIIASGPVSFERRLIGPITHLMYKPMITPKSPTNQVQLPQAPVIGEGE